LSAKRRLGGSAEAAIFVALMLVVQSLLSGLSLGAQASTLPTDALVICTTDGARLAQPSPDGIAHHAGTDCCTLGCSMVGAALPDLPREPFRFPARVESVVSRTGRDDCPIARVETFPQNPRAPPRSA
jgi:hypothetical protein